MTPGAGGAVGDAVAAPCVAGNPSGLCLRRWDGQVVGAAGGGRRDLAGKDVGVAFTARAGNYLAGDWWACGCAAAPPTRSRRVTPRRRTAAGTPSTSLAVVDLAAKTVLLDCRPTFAPLTEIKRPERAL